MLHLVGLSAHIKHTVFCLASLASVIYIGSQSWIFWYTLFDATRTFARRPFLNIFLIFSKPEQAVGETHHFPVFPTFDTIIIDYRELRDPDKRVPVNTALRVLRLRMEERPPI